MSRLRIVVAAAFGLIGLPFFSYAQHSDDVMYDLNAGVLMMHASDKDACGLVQAYALSKKPITPHQLVTYTDSMLRGFPSILMGTANVRETALYIATQGNNEEFFTLMLQARCSKKSHRSKNCLACINDECNSAIATPLHNAVQQGDLARAKALLDAGMNTNVKAKGRTPLGIAALEGNTKMMQLLKEYKARLTDDEAQRIILQNIPNKADVIDMLDEWGAFGSFGSQKRHTTSLTSAMLVGDTSLQAAFIDTAEWNQIQDYRRCYTCVAMLRQQLAEGSIAQLLTCRNENIFDKVITTGEHVDAMVQSAGGEQALFDLLIKQKNIPLLQHINNVKISSASCQKSKGILLDGIVALIVRAASEQDKNRLQMFEDVLHQKGHESGISALSHLIADHDARGVAMLGKYGVRYEDLSLEEKKWIAPRLKNKLAQQSIESICSYLVRYCGACATNAAELLPHAKKQELLLPSIRFATGTREQEFSLIKMQREVLYEACGDKGLWFMNARFAACCDNNSVLEPVAFLENVDHKSSELIDCGMSLSGCPSLLHVIASLGHVGLMSYVLERSKKLKKNGKHVYVNSCAGPDAQTPLHMATSSVAAVRLLINAGANESIKDAKGKTPLQIALERGHESTVRFLLNQPDSRNALSNAHYDMLANLNLRLSVAKILLDKGLFKDKIDDYTALDLAVFTNNTDFVNLFLPEYSKAKKNCFESSCKRIARRMGFDYQSGKTAQNDTGKEKHEDVVIIEGAHNALHYLTRCKSKKLLPKITTEKNLKAWMDAYQVSFHDLLNKCESQGNGNLLYGIALIDWKDEQMRNAYRDALAHLFLTCNPERVELLVKSSDINARGDGQSALRMAYCMQDAERIALLEKHGAFLTEPERRELWPICELYLRDGIVKRFNNTLKRALGVSN